MDTPMMLPLLIISMSIWVCQTEKILLFPFPYYSHIKELTSIGEELVKNGHQLYVILPPTLPQIEQFRNDKNIKVIEYIVKYKDFHQFSTESESALDDFLTGLMQITPIEDFRTNTDGCLELCANPLEDEDLIQRVKNEQFDFAIIDGFPISRCYYIMMYRLGIPYASLTTQYEPWLMRTPSIPSFVPFPFHIPSLSDHMTFWERLSNLYVLVDWTSFPGLPYLDDQLVSKYAPDKPVVTINWLAGRSLLWLFDTDITLDFPRPTMPNEINIGGLSVKPAKPLDKDLQAFVNNATHGVIVASFGSFSLLNKQMINVLLTAFKRVKQKVIFRFPFDNAEDQDIPDHIKLLKWIPQNDLLGHPNTKLFITHCGANSQFEALYHGVPMLNFPIYGDQPYNAKRSEYKGFSKTMSLLTATADNIVVNIELILTNNSFKDNIQHASKLFKASPRTPRQRATYWIEHVIRFGGKHLRSHALDMAWYEYLMIDVLLSFVVVCAFMITLFICFCFSLKKIICRCGSTENKIKKH